MTGIQRPDSDPIEKIKELERRLEALERSPQMQNAVLVDGGVTLYNDTESFVGRFGKQEEYGSQYGIRVHDPVQVQSPLVVLENDGMVRPWIGLAMYQPATATAVTSTSWTTVWTTVIELLTARDFLVRSQLAIAADTEVSMRLNLSGVLSTATVFAGGPFGVTSEWEMRWAHGININGGPVTLSVESKLTVGAAGTVSVYPPSAFLGGGIA